MCIRRKLKTSGLEESGIGWKVFTWDGCLRGCLSTGTEFKVGVWNKSRINKRMKEGTNPKYYPGFHFFRSKKTAEEYLGELKKHRLGYEYTIKKIEYRKPTAEGSCYLADSTFVYWLGSWFPCISAKEIKILK